MKKKVLSLLGFVFALGLVAKAQEQVSIQTDYNDPYKNKWNVGLFAGIDVQTKSSGGVVLRGGRSRYLRKDRYFFRKCCAGPH